MSLTERQIDVNFHLQKSLEFTNKNSADKTWSKKDKGVESALPHANKGFSELMIWNLISK